MFKRVLVLFLLAAFSTGAFGSITMLSPSERILEPGALVELGSIAPGETLQLVFATKSLHSTWEVASISPGLLPEAWGTEFVKENRTLTLKIFVPKDAEIQSRNLRVVLSSGDLSETIDIVINVRNGLVKSSLLEKNLRAGEYDSVKYSLRIVNESLGRHLVKVKSSLPVYWFSPFSLALEPGQVLDSELEVFPVVHGERDFSFFIDSELNSERLAVLPAAIEVPPTLQGKFISAFNGYPFFTHSLLPSYLLNALLSLIS